MSIEDRTPTTALEAALIYEVRKLRREVMHLRPNPSEPLYMFAGEPCERMIIPRDEVVHRVARLKFGPEPEGFSYRFLAEVHQADGETFQLNYYVSDDLWRGAGRVQRINTLSHMVREMQERMGAAIRKDIAEETSK